MTYYLEIQTLSEPHKWILCQAYSNESIAVERAKKLTEVIPLVKVQVTDSIGDEGKVVWSNND